MLRRCLGAASLLAGLGAQAATCTSNGGATLAFGAYQPLTFGTKLASANVDSTSTITVSCTAPVLECVNLAPITYTLRISAGASASVSARGMPGSGTAAGSTMSYNIYSESTRTTVWGNTTGTEVAGSTGRCSGSSSHVVYGRIGAGQNLLKPGSYGEPLTITLTYAP